MIVPFLLLPLAALAFSLAQDKKYSAESSVLIRDIPSSDVEGVGPPVVASEDPDRETATNIGLLSLKNIERRVERRLGGEDATASELDVTQEGESNILAITATDRSPEKAARTANAYAREYVAFRQRSSRREIAAEVGFARRELARLTPAASRGARGRGLRRQIRRLEFLERSANSGAQLASVAEPPTTPSSPKPVRNTLLAAIIGLFLAAAAALLFDRIDPRVKTPKEVEAVIERPVMGLVRKAGELKHEPSGRGPPIPYADDFLALHGYLRYSEHSRGVRSVLITSAASQDGKTTIAWNLAWAAAGPGSRVLLVEADLRHPTLAHGLGVEPRGGLDDVLDGKLTLSDAIHDVALESGDNGRLPPRVVSVVFAGVATTRPRPPASWEAVAQSVREAEDQFDLVLIDTPPIVSVPDTIPLVAGVGGVIVVGRIGNTPRAALLRLKEQLHAIDAPTLGAVVNSVGREVAADYGYEPYGYGS